MGSGTLLKRSIEKYGRDKFKKEILYDFKTSEEMFKMEKEIVNEEFVNRQDTYNITEGGHGSWASTKGTIRVTDKDGNKIRVDKNDCRLSTGELAKTYKGYALYKNSKDIILYLSNKDLRVLSNEYVLYAKNRVLVKDYNNRCYNVSVKDPRYLSGELIPFCTNKISVKDANDNNYLIDKNDPRYLSGELTPIWTGRKHKEETRSKIKNTMAEHKHQQGEKNSQFGKCWIHNLKLKENTRVKKEELEKYLKNNWIKGRKLVFK